MFSNLHRPKIWSAYCSLLLLIYPTVAKNGTNDLEKALNDTTIFFEKLKVQFGSLPASNETFESIDNRIDEFIDKVNKDKRQRSRRQLFQQDNYETESSILHDFESLPNYRIPVATDVSFFIRKSQSELHWFTAVINPEGVSLFHSDDENKIPVHFFPLANGEQILTYSSDSSSLLIIRQSTGIIKVLQLSLNFETKLFISQVQTLPTTGARHAALWTGMNRLYLGVSSPNQLIIYVWLGDNFDQIQVLDIGAEKLIPLQTGGSMILAATGPTTRIISFQLKSDKFIITQELKSSEDAIGFQRENGIFGEHFLVLAEENSTIIYKERKRRYVPFQKLEGTNQVQVLSSDRKDLLFFIQKCGGMKVFQYDGWRFSDLQIYVPRVTQVYPTFLPGGLFVLAMKSDQNDWTFHRMIWRTTKSFQTIKDDILLWCRASLRSLETPSPKIPPLKHPLVFTNVHIQHLTASNVNGRDAQEFVNITNSYKRVLSRLAEANRRLETVVSLDNPVFTNLSAKKVKVMSKVIANNTETAMAQDFMDKLRTPGDTNNMAFKTVKASSVTNFRCPIPAVQYQEVQVTGSVNGLSFNAFAEDTLKTTGETQTMTGQIHFDSLKADEGDLDLDVAWNSTRQELRFTNITVDELKTPSGYLLPLNGEAVTMTGDLTVSRAEITGLIHLRGTIGGEGSRRLIPMIEVLEPLVLEGHYYLDNIKVVELLEGDDLVGPNGESYKEIRRNALPLKSKSIPVHMRFLSERVEWGNVTLTETPGNWITRSSRLNITGRKSARNLTLSQSTYSNLPLPVVSGKACAVGLLTHDIYTTNITLNSARVGSLTAGGIFGAWELDEVLADAVRSWAEVPWELKTITGEVKAAKARIPEVADVDLPGLYESRAKWAAPGVLQGPVRVKSLRVKHLRAEEGFKIPLPKNIRRLETLGNVNVTRVNGIDVLNFIENAVEIDDMISLTNITFLGGLNVESVTASTSNIPFVKTLKGNFGAKTVSGGLSTKHLVMPDALPFPPADAPVELIATGNVTFVSEPNIKNINNVNLEKLAGEIWMKNKPAKLRGKFISLKNVTLEGPVDVSGEVNTPMFGSWSEMPKKILSKSLDQEIPRKMHFESLQAVKIIGSNNSKLISSPSTGFYDLEHHSLKIIGDQTVSLPWSFEKIIVQDSVKINGVVNDLDLNNEVLRTDSRNNVITGRIIVDTLKATNIDGLKFNDFARNTLRASNYQELVVIKGKKTFKDMKMKSLNLTSTIRGKHIESCLLKHSNQTITGRKVIKGRLVALGIVTEGLVNDVDLTKLLVYQLKKNSPLQVIETPIVLQNGLNVLGNLTIDGLVQGVELSGLGEAELSTLRMQNLLGKLSDYSRLAEAIDLALQDRAFYFDKLEMTEENSTPLIEVLVNESVRFEALGDCHVDNYLLHCNNTGIFDFSGMFNASEVLELKAGALDGSPRIVCVTSGSLGGVSVYSFDEEKLEMTKEAEIQIPGIVGGAVATYMGSVWIVLGLQENMVVLRYRGQREFQEHVIPGSEHFALGSGLSDELLLFRNDGVWRLGGVVGTTRVFKANLKGEIAIFQHAGEQYVQLRDGSTTSLLKAHYVGN
ncbi:uncharacterized protein LOC107038711 [Diachasma alloeum]|uniref:uncharacterized protein LOC107038711 n=1 Tax=Diachasma alloeum TaxID=454923 RepID=UPI0007381A87|nr:uncharacterized protein LOC107038711 [Diachasma alloeum]